MRNEQNACLTHFKNFYNVCKYLVSGHTIYLDQTRFPLLKLTKCHSAVETETIPPPASPPGPGDQIAMP